MGEVAKHVAKIMALGSREGRRQALQHVPHHLQTEVKALVQKLWPQRRRRGGKQA